MELLTCTRCKETKPATQEFFPPHKQMRSGFNSWCRKCRATYRRNINGGKFRAVISDEALMELKTRTKKCGICRVEGKKLAVDHDHVTGKIRGMLCIHCNVGLGHFKDSEKLLRLAIKYLGRTENGGKVDSKSD